MTTSTHPADTSTDGARIDTTRDAMQQALEALELCRLNGSQYLYGPERDIVFSAVAALRAALAEQAQPLTDEDIYIITGHCGVSKHAATSIARAVEAAVLERMGAQR